MLADSFFFPPFLPLQSLADMNQRSILFLKCAKQISKRSLFDLPKRWIELIIHSLQTWKVKNVLHINTGYQLNNPILEQLKSITGNFPKSRTQKGKNYRETGENNIIGAPLLAHITVAVM